MLPTVCICEVREFNRVAKGIAALRPLRTGHDSFPSSGSTPFQVTSYVSDRFHLCSVAGAVFKRSFLTIIADLRAAFRLFIYRRFRLFISLQSFACLPNLKFFSFTYAKRTMGFSRLPLQGNVSTPMIAITATRSLVAHSYSRLPTASFTGCLPNLHWAVFGVTLLPGLDTNGLAPNSSPNMLVIHVN